MQKTAALFLLAQEKNTQAQIKSHLKGLHNLTESFQKLEELRKIDEIKNNL